MFEAPLRPSLPRSPAPWRGPRAGTFAPHAHAETGGENAGFLTAVTYIFATLVFFRLMISDPLMNLVVNYSGEGGSIIEKIHPCTQGMILLLMLTLLKVRITLTAAEAVIVRQMMILMAVIVMLVVLVQVAGRSIAMGYLLETYIGGCLAGILMYALPHENRRVIGNTIVFYIVINSALSIIEKAGSFRIYPYPFNEATFRPTAFTSHPLAIGLFNAGASVFVLATRWRPMVKAGCLLLCVMGAFASGARTGAIFTALSVLGALAITSMPGASSEGRLRLRILLFGTMVFGGALLIAVAAAAGFLERFEGGYVDENAQARIDVYKVFEWVSWNEILFGADLLEIKAMVMERLKLLIESSVVIFVFQFGLFGAILFAGTILWTFWRLAQATDWRALIAVATFFATAMSNDTLSGKHVHMTTMILLLIAFRSNRLDGEGLRRHVPWER